MIKLKCTKKNGKLKKRKIELEKMSYSRWIDSMFYTYWCVSDAKNKNDEVFICHTEIYKCYRFKYIECKRIIENLITIKGKINEIDDDEDATELQGYIKQFIIDVDTEYANV